MSDYPLLATEAVLATEVLAWTLVSKLGYPGLSEEDLAAARMRLSNAFQEAWIDECVRLSKANAR